jgi:chromosome segregation ATPase
LAESKTALSSLKERYTAQAQLLSMLLQTNAGHHVERSVLEDTNEKLREAAEDYKLQIHTAQQRIFQLEQYIQDINVHVNYLETAKKELTVQNELLQDQVALVFLTPGPLHRPARCN